ncbi:class I SAM-dependent methyltransferase [Nocardia sp. NPDC046763]|uniref:class I SAM-dependent methyltransferase n=1 Tax=Nocardia sp. NPDC046763 TaxID=3155256 RepID=UPI0033D9281B
MDLQTLSSYDSEAEAYAEDWHTQPTPTDLQTLVHKFFRLGPTADVGCGAGRDAAWLASQGFTTVGFDPSEGLLAEARKRHPSVTFRNAALPNLAGVEAGSFTNVLCETVIMHLDPALLRASLQRLTDVLAPGGTLYLSWRVVENSHRDGNGRLYTPVDRAVVRRGLDGTELLLDEESTSASSGKTVHQLVVRRAG